MIGRLETFLPLLKSISCIAPTRNFHAHPMKCNTVTLSKHFRHRLLFLKGVVAATKIVVEATVAILTMVTLHHHKVLGISIMAISPHLSMRPDISITSIGMVISITWISTLISMMATGVLWPNCQTPSSAVATGDGRGMRGRNSMLG